MLGPVAIILLLPTIIILIIIIADALSVVELVYSLQPLDSPVGKFPCLRPPDVHILRADDNHDQVDAFITDTCRKARASGWRDSSLNTVNSSLSEHQMGVVPFVSFPIAIRILLNDVSLRAHHLFEFL